MFNSFFKLLIESQVDRLCDQFKFITEMMSDTRRKQMMKANFETVDI